MNKSSDSYKVYLDKSEAAKSGILRSQPETRKSLPPVDNSVKVAKEDKGAAKKCADQQFEENRKYINKHVEDHQGQ